MMPTFSLGLFSGPHLSTMSLPCVSVDNQISQELKHGSASFHGEGAFEFAPRDQGFLGPYAAHAPC